MTNSEKQINTFIEAYPQQVCEIANRLRKFVKELVPSANELVWDNYNALAIAYSKSEKLKDAFCNLALYGKHVNFGFNRGAELSDSAIKLEGQGKLIRHLKVHDFEKFPVGEVAPIVMEALGISEERNAQLRNKSTEGKCIIMSVSEKKRRPV